MRSANYLIAAYLLLPACGGFGSNAVVPAPQGTTTIYEIQGAGPSSPFAGEIVTVTGVVTGDFQSGDSDRQSDLGGFFMQAEVTDGDDATSDGIFVFDRGTGGRDIDVHDRVTVTGTVVENFGETQIDPSAITFLGRGIVAPTELTFPIVSTTTNSDGKTVADLEAFEGMFVAVPQDLFVTELNDLQRFGELTLSAGDRLYQFTNSNVPDSDAYAMHMQRVAARTLVLDDGLTAQNAHPIRYLFPDPDAAPGHAIRAGDIVTGLTGVIRFSRASGGAGAETWRLVPIEDPAFLAANPRPAGPPDPGGSIRVASFNVLNFFTTIDTGQNICGPAGNARCRGADSAEEFDRQRRKIIRALTVLDADVVGLIELENNAGASLRAVVDGLNDVHGADTWSYIDTGSIGSDVIAVGFIYRPSAITPQGTFAVLDSGFDPRFDDSRNRPPLAQTFAAKSGGTFTLVLNHLKSKGSSCNADGDPDTGDGQGNCNRTRVNAVVALVDWLAADPTGSSDADFLVIGDMNAYLDEDPIRAFEDAGYVNLLRPTNDAYSFLFRGQAGALDHAFASPSLAGQTAGAREWHINADEPPVLDYNLDFGRDPAWFDPTSPYRASDHDPVVIGLDPR